MSRHRTSRWFVVLPLVVMTSSTLIAARRPEAAPSCTAVHDWVVAHRAELPTTYAEIIRYPLDYRRQIQAQLPWNVRRDLWRAQYHVYMESGLLTSDQVAFVRRADAKLDEMFNATTSQARREQLGDSVAAEAVTILGRDLTHLILFVLGPETRVNPSASPAVPTPQYFVLAANRRPVDVPALEINCTCHYGVPEPECTSSQNCTISNCTANGIMNGGCGTNGMYSCNGVCQ